MKYVVGNWKMHLGVRESVALARGVLRGMRGKDVNPDVVLCPPFTSLSEVHKVLARSRVSLGAQNCGPERNGAFTGEVSISMLEDVHAEFVLIGHSERRHILGETDELIAKKMQLITTDSNMTPIFCVGETQAVREAGEAYGMVGDQIRAALAQQRFPKRQKLLIAYEPVWAIGSGETPTVGDVIDMHVHIRNVISKETGLPRERVGVLYGGSVDESNAYTFLRESDVDGLLVGGASLKLASFSAIIDSARDVIASQG